MTSPRRTAGSPILLAVFLLALAAPLPGCGSSAESGTARAATTNEGESRSGDGDGEKKKADKKETPVPVEVVALARGDIESVLRSTTNLEAEKDVKIYSQAARLVQELLVEEGDRVEPDEVLLRLQDDEQRSALAKVRSDYDKTKREYDRQKRLFENELISEEMFNTATYELDQLQISLEDAERELSYTEVRAPLRGTITARLVNIGDQVTVGQHLFDLVDFDSIVARIYIPEKELPRLRVGQTALVSTQGGGDARRGRVDRISPIVDPQTGTVKVTVAFGGGQGLRPGMYVDVKLVAEVHRDVVLLPKRALVYDQDQVFVYRLDEERRVERLLVQPILEDKEHVEPLGGLEAGDAIVVAGQAGLKDRALVRLPGDPDPEEEAEGDGSEEDDAVVARGE